ncbi:MAG: glycosyltransferase family 2 protein [Flavobacteriaceae bacterium]
MNNISIIIVNYKSWIPLENCLNSLLKQENVNTDIIVVDNNSSDNTLEQYKKMFPSVEWIENKKNYGFSKACNIGESKSKYDLLLFLNPDTILEKNCLEKIFKKNIDYNSKIISIKQIDKKKKNTNAYGYFLSFHTYNGLLRFFYRLIFRKTKKINERLDYFYPDWISGSFVIISKNKFHIIGKWDERFWMYYEDMDLCKRAKENDMEIIMLNDIFCYHFHGLSSRINYKTKIKSKTEVLISKIKYVKKHFNGFKKFLLLSLIYASILLELTIMSIFSKVKREILINFCVKQL